MTRALLSLLALLLSFPLTAQQPDPRPRPSRVQPAITIGDGSGNAVRDLTIGRNVVAGATGLSPGRLYELLLLDDRGTLVSMLRLSADKAGAIAPAVLWYQSGVVGCGAATENHLKQPHRFRTFEEAESKLRGRSFAIELREAVKRGAARPKAIASRRFGVSTDRTPVVYFSDAKGCLMNATDGSDEVSITGRNFLRGTIADIAVVEDQAEWRLGDPFADVRRLKETQVVRLAEGATGFTVPVWRRGAVPVGTYDVIVRPYQSGSDRAVTPFIDYRDVVGWRGDVGIVVYDPHNSHLVEQIAGRTVSGYPWFKHVDGFPLLTDVWGALDPKRKPPNHLGTYAAWYVVDDKPLWTNGDALNDVSGGTEVTPIKPGCINHTWTLLWPAPAPANVNAANPTRPYDVVIDFGNLSQTEMGFASDGVYTEGTDFVDYYGAVGFHLVRDPRLPGSLQVGDVEEPPLNTPCTLDLDGIMITWTDPVFTPNQINVAIGDDDLGGEDGRCGMQTPQLVEMRAHIWYPKDPNSNAVAPGGPYPVVLFYHGQQQAALPGYEGYDYMGLLLASHGFIVYSVDARDTLNATIASRGEHIRAHMRKLVALNQNGSGSIFEQQLDLQNTTIVGHSRGGDAVVAAWEWQRVQPDAGYAFKAVSAIAPVQKFNVWPNEPQFVSHIRDVPYQIIHGGKDGDVSDFQGLRMYDRAADIRLAGQTPKSMVFVKDANHKNFNTEWAQTIDDYCCGGVIPPGDQQDTTRVYIHSFVQAYIRNRPEYIHFLDGTIPYPGAATVSLDFQRPVADVVAIDHHEVIAPVLHDKTTNAVAGAVSENGIPDYDERLLAVSQPVPWSSYQGDTFAATLSWNANTDTYSTAIPPAVMNALDPLVTTHLAFRVGQVHRVGGPNPANANQNFAVRLHDTDGDLSPMVWVRDFGTVFPPWETMEGGIKTVMGLVRIPLQVFTVNTSSAVDLTKLDRIDFVFSGVSAGEIAFDDIRFTK